MVLASVLEVSGCALTPGRVNISYTPVDSAEVTKLVEAEPVDAQVVVSDQRLSKDAVGHKSNGYGMEMAPITSDNDVPETLRSAIESELTRRGFTIGRNGTTVAVTLTKFENRFKNGFWSGTAAAEVVMSVVVKNRNGGIAYAKLIDTEGVNPGIRLASAENAQIALDRGLQQAVSELFADSTFLNSLQAGGKTTTRQLPQPSPPRAVAGVSEKFALRPTRDLGPSVMALSRRYCNRPKTPYPRPRGNGSTEDLRGVSLSDTQGRNPGSL